MSTPVARLYLFSGLGLGDHEGAGMRTNTLRKANKDRVGDLEGGLKTGVRMNKKSVWEVIATGEMFSADTLMPPPPTPFQRNLPHLDENIVNAVDVDVLHTALGHVRERALVAKGTVKASVAVGVPCNGPLAAEHELA